MTQLCLLGLSGSLRRASNSTAVLRGLQDATLQRGTLFRFDGTFCNPSHTIP
jgi:chromate reductase, NAD(P)H dehydrogenase (quinone)